MTHGPWLWVGLTELCYAILFRHKYGVKLVCVRAVGLHTEFFGVLRTIQSCVWYVTHRISGHETDGVILTLVTNYMLTIIMDLCHLQKNC